ncbi:hypothetical protein [Paracoccus benzoatiresistens]|uniref:Uncharacterized protein n=1 Tax=Paracoccus benzoatiresistens TaxID=2997341 RepID=A0ABT4J6H4_9RHOB|nr:hypothetical protein [Paracoccus sp. EF6]MCZ0962733.1 hypothetical protein [Paracoccus sp. EF6]
MSEWGIPDWRDPSAYGDISQWTFNCWRWEFYRRRDDLRAYFDANAASHFSSMVDIFGHNYSYSNTSEISFSIPISRFDRERAELGYESLPNPRIGNQPEWLIIPLSYGKIPDFIVKGRRYKDYAKKLEIAVKLVGMPISDKELGRLISTVPGASSEAFFDDNEIAFVIDLDKPLENQIWELKRRAHDRQRIRYGRILQERRHEKKWFRYLRTLDARTAGATWSQIACLHPTTAQTEQTARDVWEAAEALRFNL